MKDLSELKKDLEEKKTLRQSAIACKVKTPESQLRSLLCSPEICDIDQLLCLHCWSPESSLLNKQNNLKAASSVSFSLFFAYHLKCLIEFEFIPGSFAKVSHMLTPLFPSFAAPSNYTTYKTPWMVKLLFDMQALSRCWNRNKGIPGMLKKLFRKQTRRGNQLC